MVKITKIDYNIAKTWWIGHNRPIIPEEMLPDTSIMIWFGNKPICGCWLYLTNSSIGIVEGVISDPESQKDIRNTCLNILITELKTLNKVNNKTILLALTSNEFVKKRLLLNKFISGDNLNSFYFKGDY